jgi:hypothetical protein
MRGHRALARPGEAARAGHRAASSARSWKTPYHHRRDWLADRSMSDRRVGRPKPLSRCRRPRPATSVWCRVSGNRVNARSLERKSFRSEMHGYGLDCGCRRWSPFGEILGCARTTSACVRRESCRRSIVACIRKFAWPYISCRTQPSSACALFGSRWTPACRRRILAKHNTALAGREEIDALFLLSKSRGKLSSEPAGRINQSIVLSQRRCSLASAW